MRNAVLHAIASALEAGMEPGFALVSTITIASEMMIENEGNPMMLANLAAYFKGLSEACAKAALTDEAIKAGPQSARPN